MENYGIKEEEGLWFDVFSNNQFNIKDKDFNWFKTVYKDAIKNIKRVLMIYSPWPKPIALTNEWCIYQIYCAYITNSSFEITFSKVDENKIFSMSHDFIFLFEIIFNNIDSKIFESSNPENKKYINKVVVKNIEEYSEIVKIVKEQLIKKIKNVFDNYLNELEKEIENKAGIEYFFYYINVRKSFGKLCLFLKDLDLAEDVFEAAISVVKQNVPLKKFFNSIIVYLRLESLYINVRNILKNYYEKYCLLFKDFKKIIDVFEKEKNLDEEKNFVITLESDYYFSLNGLLNVYLEKNLILKAKNLFDSYSNNKKVFSFNNIGLLDFKLGDDIKCRKIFF